ncbi:hypothetical protein B0T11DRAFT_29197 [Plectosphaerella cucumerina]|uniref:Uncharacterized protein n=1 Tax=Plectosphaerella cucumerina TaxID=40658 RepID=A0A8K0TVF4_9PEZI|nr:hypothetical protein B0T11DRAFT_29197 [Plectosphaerella cucumerina]
MASSTSVKRESSPQETNDTFYHINQTTVSDLDFHLRKAILAYEHLCQEICQNEATANEASNLGRENALLQATSNDQRGQPNSAGDDNSYASTRYEGLCDDSQERSTDRFSRDFNDLMLVQYRNEIIQQDRVIETKDAEIRRLVEIEAGLQSKLSWLQRHSQFDPEVRSVHKETDVVTRPGKELLQKEEEDVRREAVSLANEEVRTNHDGERSALTINRNKNKKAHRRARKLKQRKRARAKRKAGDPFAVLSL